MKLSPHIRNIEKPETGEDKIDSAFLPLRTVKSVRRDWGCNRT